MSTRELHTIMGIFCMSAALLAFTGSASAVEPTGGADSVGASNRVDDVKPTWGERMRSFGRRASEGFGSAYAGNEPETVWDHLKDRLEIGLRFTDYDLDETMRPADESQTLTFIGRVNQLEQEDESTPVLNVTVLLTPIERPVWLPEIGIDWTYDEVSARTRNFNTGLSDGVLEMSGPVWSVVFRYPIGHERMTWVQAITPWIGFGQADWDATFKHDAWWTRGWNSPENFIANGSPPGNRNGASRIIDVSDDSSSVTSYGIIIQVTEYFAVDFMWNEIDLESDAKFLRNGGLRRVGSFPMSHSRSAFGARYTF